MPHSAAEAGGQPLGRGRAQLGQRLRSQFGQNLPGRVSSIADARVQVVHFAAAVVSGQLLPLLLFHLFQVEAVAPRFLFQQLAPQRNRLLTLMRADPMLNLVPRPRGAHQLEPVAAGRMPGLGENLDDLAVSQLVPQGHDAPVDLCPHAPVAHLGVDGVGKVHRRGFARQNNHLALGREGIDLLRIEVDFERREEFARVLHFPRPVNHRPQPGNPLLVVRRHLGALFVAPVGGDAFFRHSVHFLRPDLHLKGVAGGVNEGGVQRLVEVRPRHGDVVLEPPGNRPPELMHHSQRRVAVPDRIGDHAYRQQVEDLAQVHPLARHLLMNGVKPLDAPVNLR